MKHCAVYATYNVLSPVVYRSLNGGLVFSNTSTNLFSKSSLGYAPAVGDIDIILRKGSSKCLEKLNHLSNSVEKPEIELCKRCRLRHVSLSRGP